MCIKCMYGQMYSCQEISVLPQAWCSSCGNTAHHLLLPLTSPLLMNSKLNTVLPAYMELQLVLRMN